VLAIDVTPGLVTADVQGSRPKPYRVQIGLRPFPEPVWRRIESLLSAQAFYSARLLAGDLPPELEQVFAEAGAPLFPAGIDDLELSCNCPDFAVPCKHLAATFYLLAEAFDADPFRILHWRGRERAGLLARLRELRTGGDSPAGAPGRKPAPVGTSPGQTTVPAAASPDRGSVSDGGSPSRSVAPASVAGAGAALAELPDVPLADSVDRFWSPPVPLPARIPALPARADLLLRQLGAPGAVIGGPGLTERLRRAYECFGAG